MFEVAVEGASADQQAFLRPLCEWAAQLESLQLARLSTHRGANGAILRVAVPAGRSLVTVTCRERTASIQPFRGVFTSRAPAALAKVEELTGLSVKDGTAVRELKAELLDVLTSAYHEAATGKSGA
jgi:hypothetical protein